MKNPHEPNGYPMTPRCTAIKKNGERCKAVAIAPTTKCHYHGGKSRAGIASPNFKTGRFSKYLPGGYRQAYEEALADPELLNMSDAIAELYARHHELLGRLGKHPAPVQISEEWRRFRAASAARDGHAMTESAERLDSLIAGAVADDATWGEIQRVLAQIAALTKAERDRRIEMSALIPVQSATNFARELLLAVRDEVNPHDWARVQNRVTAIVGRMPAVTDAEC